MNNKNETKMTYYDVIFVSFKRHYNKWHFCVIFSIYYSVTFFLMSIIKMTM